ncbi:unnamed protein product [Periconia digitata]|uniref:Uncharacterized protein n=1 Tax=Periconia digitata TaxID=1303443 RepID=A0A9W4XX19_9PLEO|nr:unnamed protein product [Periconia digitata]
MRLPIVSLFAFAPAALAALGNDAPPRALTSAPSSVAESTLTAPQSTSLHIPVTTPPSSFLTSIISPNSTVAANSTRTSRTRKPHTEPIPIFSSRCDCPNLATVAYPCWATDALQRCEFEELHSFVCWTSAARGCPTPTRSCRSFFTPQPVTGRHPCDIGMGNPPEPTAIMTSTLADLTSATLEPTA